MWYCSSRYYQRKKFSEMVNWIDISFQSRIFEKYKEILLNEFKNLNVKIQNEKNNEKIIIVRHSGIFELVFWYEDSIYRKRKLFRLPKSLFTPGHFEILREGKFQTFNPPIKYLNFRYGVKWRTPINSYNRSEFEHHQYWNK